MSTTAHGGYSSLRGYSCDGGEHGTPARTTSPGSMPGRSAHVAAQPRSLSSRKHVTTRGVCGCRAPPARVRQPMDSMAPGRPANSACSKLPGGGACDEGVQRREAPGRTARVHATSRGKRSTARPTQGTSLPNVVVACRHRLRGAANLFGSDVAIGLRPPRSPGKKKQIPPTDCRRTRGARPTLAANAARFDIKQRTSFLVIEAKKLRRAVVHARTASPATPSSSRS